MDIIQLDDQIGASDLFTKSPHVLLFLAKPGSGKSTIMLNMLLQSKAYRGVYDQIFIWSKNFYSDSKQLLLLQNITLANERTIDESSVKTAYIPQEIIDITEDLTRSRKTLFIFDDFAINVSKDPFMQQIMIDRRHKNLSVWITGQRLKLFSKAIRTMADSWIVSSLSTKSERREACDDIVGSHGITNEEFNDMLDYCTQQPYGFLYSSPSGIYNRFNEEFNF